MSTLTTFKRFSAFGLCTLLLSAAHVANAQESTQENTGREPGIEINLDALQGLEEAQTTGDPAIPLPPALDADQTDGPPALTPAPRPVQNQPEPQSPAAPQTDVVSIDPTPPSIAKSQDGRVVALLFEPGINTLTLAAAERLDAIAAEIVDDAIRLQLVAYAGTEEQSPSETRRLALQRAIAVRGYLMDKGVAGTRIDLRPQGPVTDDSAPERIDVTFVAQ